MSLRNLCHEDEDFKKKIDNLTTQFCIDNSLVTHKAWLQINSAMLIGALTRQEHVMNEFLKRKKERKRR